MKTPVLTYRAEALAYTVRRLQDCASHGSSEKTIQGWAKIFEGAITRASEEDRRQVIRHNA